MSPPILTAYERSLARVIHVACVVEATARKPGNVHPEASFNDLAHSDFLDAAGIVAPILSLSRTRGVGRSVLDSVMQCREQLGSNVNLGIVLLIAPLAAVPEKTSLCDGIESVLNALTVDDSRQVYDAIRVAKPGGLGTAPKEDVSSAPTLRPREIMRLASSRDSIAAEYAEGFPRVLKRGLTFLSEMRGSFASDWEHTVIQLHLEFMAAYPDTLIARKCGAAVADESAKRARDLLNAGWPNVPESHDRFAEFDHWLRADGHRRNPGTTADLVAASLFAAFREESIPFPAFETFPP